MQKELETARDLAISAGMILLEYYGKNADVEWKGADSPVTVADRAASRFLDGELKRRFPEDGILSEEESDDLSRLDRSRVWIIDPMDGTKEFINGLGEFAVMIGLAIDRISVIGVVHQPTTGKTYYAVSGSGAYLEEAGKSRKLRVSPEIEPSRMTVALSRSHDSMQVDEVRRRLGINRSVRSGSLGLKVGLICEGRAHLYLHIGSRTYQWDTCAPDVILREAGGVMTDIRGVALSYNLPEPRNLRGVIASNGPIHERIIEAAGQVMKEL